MTYATLENGTSLERAMPIHCISVHPLICRGVCARLLRRAAIIAGVITNWHMSEVCMRRLDRHPDSLDCSAIHFA